MAYFVNFLRFPSPGKVFEVLAAMKAAHAAAGRPGNITIPVSASNPTGSRPGLISLVGGFSTLDDVDSMQIQFFDNEQMQQGQNGIDAMCERTSYAVSEILSGGPTLPDGYEPTVVSRLIMEAKIGKTQDLIDASLDVREKTGGDVKNVISRSITGSISTVRVSVFATSLQELEDKRVETLKHIGKMPDLLAASPVRHIGRIVYSSRG